MDKKSLVVSSLTGYKEEIGRWLWCLEDVRRTLMTELTGTRHDLLDKKLGERPTIGTLLYHIALIEADWLLHLNYRVQELNNQLPK